MLVSTFDTSNVAVAHNLRSCSRTPSETKTKTRQAETKTETKTSRVDTKTKTTKSGLDRSGDQDQVSRPTSLQITIKNSVHHLQHHYTAFVCLFTVVCDRRRGELRVTLRR